MENLWNHYDTLIATIGVVAFFCLLVIWYAVRSNKKATKFDNPFMDDNICLRFYGLLNPTSYKLNGVDIDALDVLSKVEGEDEKGKYVDVTIKRHKYFMSLAKPEDLAKYARVVKSDNQMNEMPTYTKDDTYIQGIINAATNQIKSRIIPTDLNPQPYGDEQPQTKPTEVPAKRSHASRRALFCLDTAIADGMAILVDGKSHVYVGLKSQYPFDELYYIRGISNGQAYGVTQATDKGKIRNNIYDVKELNRYLINIRK